jgi:hypothetical protein
VDNDKRASWYVGRPVKNAGEAGRGRRGNARVSVDWEGVYVDAARRVLPAGRVKFCRLRREVEEQAKLISLMYE